MRKGNLKENISYRASAIKRSDDLLLNDNKEPKLTRRDIKLLSGRTDLPYKDQEGDDSIDPNDIKLGFDSLPGGGRQAKNIKGS